MAKKYYWLRLKDDFFNSKEMKKLRKIAGGDTYVIIYLKMQLLSIKEDGAIYFDGIEEDFASEIALTLDEDEENVKVTVAFLSNAKLLEVISDEEIFLPQAENAIGTDTSSTERVRKHRRLKQLAQRNTNETLHETLHETNETLQCNAEIEIEKEKRDRDRDRDRADYQQIADLYNNTCVSFPKCTTLSETRKKAIKARFNSGYTTDDFKKLFEKAENSSFLKGSNNRNWSANFDWLIKDANIGKVLDGNYDDKLSVNQEQSDADRYDFSSFYGSEK